MNTKTLKKQTVGILLDRDFDDADDGIQEILQQFNDIANEDSVFEFINDIPTLDEEQDND
tara:strand:- start:91 stop:270 length:180 start_codon:yes stop_codon:yes gene_type:complete